MSSTIQGSSKHDGEGRGHDMKDVVLFYEGLPCGNEIVEAYRRTTEGFVDVRVGSGVRGLVVRGYLVRGRTDNAGRLSDVHLAGGSAKALSDWVGWRGSAVGSGLTNGSSAAAAKVRHRALERKLACKKGSTATKAVKIGSCGD